MSKDRVKEKSEKKEKRSEKHGVKKDKKEKSKVNGEAVARALEAVDVEEMDVDIATPVGALVPFANPLADDKATKKVLKSVKKAAKNKTLKRGVKEVIKALRKSPMGGPSAAPGAIPGIVILAADISPMDVISHIPVLCEDHNVPYLYVTSRAELGAAGSTKRPTSVVMVTEKNSKATDEDEEFKTVYADLLKLVQKEMRTVRV